MKRGLQSAMDSLGAHFAELRPLLTRFPAEAIDVNRCERIACREAGYCRCDEYGLYPRVNGYELSRWPNGIKYWSPAGRKASRKKTSKTTRARILARDGRCMRCGATDDLEVDHIVPTSRGGGNDDANLQALCGSCNRRKWCHHPELLAL